MRFHFNDIISFPTTFMTLKARNVVSQASSSAGPVELEDMVEAEVEKIGVLRTPVVGRDVNLGYARDTGLASS